MTSAWLIEYQSCSIPAWISGDVVNHSFGVTYDPKKARRFTNGEDARNEILRLGLAADWQAVERTVSGLRPSFVR